MLLEIVRVHYYSQAIISSFVKGAMETTTIIAETEISESHVRSPSWESFAVWDDLSLT